DVVAFLVAKNKPKEVPDFKQPDLKDMVQAGRAAGLAWAKQAAKARDEARKIRSSAWQLEALVAIADAPGEDAEVQAAVEEAVGVAEKALQSPTRLAELGPVAAGKSPRRPDLERPAWAVLRLVPIGLRVGVAEDRLLALAAKISRADRLRGWAELPVFRARLA